MAGTAARVAWKAEDRLMKDLRHLGNEGGVGHVRAVAAQIFLSHQSAQARVVQILGVADQDGALRFVLLDRAVEIFVISLADCVTHHVHGFSPHEARHVWLAPLC